MIWRDFLNDFKSHHSNGKYDYEYFTDLWDLKLSQDKIPNINKYEESSRINSEKEYKSEESRSIMDFWILEARILKKMKQQIEWSI